MFQAERIANVPAGTFGPYVAATPNGSVVAFAVSEGPARFWYGVALDAAGKAGRANKLGPAPAEVGLAVLEPNGSEFVLLTSSKNGATTYVEALTLTATATASGRTKRVAEVKGDVLWIDLVGTSRDALAFWAVRRDSGADLFAAPAGAGESSPVEVARGATAWQASSFGAGAALGIVSGGDSRGGKVDVIPVEVTGKPKDKLAISASPTAEADLDMVRVGQNLVLGWTDRRELDEHVYVAAVDASGKLVRPPSSGPEPLGDQAFVRLVPPLGSGPAYLAWEDVSDRPDKGRAIRLARLDANGALGSERAEILHEHGESVPELTASQTGVAALTLWPSCAKDADCSAAPRVATFVELDQKLVTMSSEPLRLAVLSGEAPDLSWGLSCAVSPCRVLGAQATDPAPIYWVAMGKSGVAWHPAARSVERPAGPRPTQVRALAKLDPIADVSATQLEGNTLAAWVTDFDPNAPMEKLTKPAPDGRFDPVRSTLAVRAVPEGKEALETQTLSIRARSLGGVSIRAGVGDVKEALVAWTALDNKVPQVFVTVVDASGKKLRQRMVTRAPGEKTDVALSAIGDGWMLAWIDERGGDPEVYAVRLNKFLQSAGPEKRITNAAGAASDVSLLTRGNTVLAVWADARSKERPGWASLFSATLAGADASLVGSEQKLGESTTHAHSPKLAALDKGSVLAWVESTPTAGGGTQSGAIRVAQLDDSGKASAAQTIALPRGTPSSVALDCAGDACRVVLAAAIGDRAELEAFHWKPAASTKPVRLVGLLGPASQAVAIELGSAGAVTMDRAGDEGRVRQIVIDWSK
jgi:hypothetical protein